jgi:hypothetical protein
MRDRAPEVDARLIVGHAPGLDRARRSRPRDTALPEVQAIAALVARRRPAIGILGRKGSGLPLRLNAET